MSQPFDVPPVYYFGKVNSSDSSSDDSIEDVYELMRNNALKMRRAKEKRRLDDLKVTLFKQKDE